MEKYYQLIIFELVVLAVLSLLVLLFNRVLNRWSIKKVGFIYLNGLPQMKAFLILILNTVCIIFGVVVLDSNYIAGNNFDKVIINLELILLFGIAPVLMFFGFVILRSIFSRGTNDFEENKVCQWLEIKISVPIYLNKAKEIVREESEKHPNLIDNRSYLDIEKGVPLVIVKSFKIDDYSTVIQVYSWAQNYSTAFVMKYELHENIRKRLAAEDIEVFMPIVPSNLNFLATQNIV
jgi:hypothetical protein